MGHHPKPTCSTCSRRSSAHARRRRRRRQGDLPVRRGLELRRGRRRRPLRAGHARRTWRAPASAPSTTGSATRYAAAGRSTPTRASRASPPVCTPTRTATRERHAAAQKAQLLHDQDLIQVGLTGNLASYSFTDTAGKTVTGAQVDYNGSPAGYAANPGGRDHLRRRPRQRDPVRRARLQTARRDIAGRPGPDAGPRAGDRQHCRRGLASARRAAICCAPSRSTATPSTPATGSTRSTGTARPATASGRGCRRPPPTRPSGRSCGRCWRIPP